MAVDDFSIGLRGAVSREELVNVARATDSATIRAPVDKRRLDTVKFASCLPDCVIADMLTERDADRIGLGAVIEEPITLSSS